MQQVKAKKNLGQHFLTDVAQWFRSWKHQEWTWTIS